MGMKETIIQITSLLFDAKYAPGYSVILNIEQHAISLFPLTLSLLFPPYMPCNTYSIFQKTR